MDITANLLTVNSTSNFTGLNADVNVSPAGNGRLTVAPSGGGNIDGVNIGLTKAASVTTNNLTATSGTINNTTIGAVTPANATFATAQVQAKPTSATTVTNKKYVDSRASAMAVAFGM